MSPLYTGEYVPKTLIASKDNLVIKPIVLEQSSEIYKEASVLGKLTKEFVELSGISYGASNTGNGVVTPSSVTLGEDSEVGTYKLKCIEAQAGAGVFEIQTPKGTILPSLTVNVAYANDQLNLTVQSGTTDFIVGDTIDIDITVGSGKYKLTKKTAVDGSEKAVVILTEEIDASSGDKKASAYFQGEFVRDSLEIDSSYSISEVEAMLAENQIHLFDSRKVQ